jgi:hypothetical protein
MYKVNFNLLKSSKPCGSESVYTRLNAYREWIDEKIELN